jgi:hypothetical protein
LWVVIISGGDNKLTLAESAGELLGVKYDLNFSFCFVHGSIQAPDRGHGQLNILYAAWFLAIPGSALGNQSSESRLFSMIAMFLYTVVLVSSKTKCPMNDRFRLK